MLVEIELEGEGDKKHDHSQEYNAIWRTIQVHRNGRIPDCRGGYPECDGRSALASFGSPHNQDTPMSTYGLADKRLQAHRFSPFDQDYSPSSRALWPERNQIRRSVADKYGLAYIEVM